MQVSDFISTFRLQQSDLAYPYLWSDDEIVVYLNDAENEACIRARLIEDWSTPAVCTVTLVPNVSTYELHASVLDVRRVMLNGTRRLGFSSPEAEDATDAAWQSRRGEPLRYIANEGSLTVVPTPVVAGTLALTVYRLPLKQLSADIDSARPEVHAKHHARLMDWVFRCAYRKQDSDTLDQEKSDRYEADFTASFGPRPTANVLRKQRDRRPPVVSMMPGA